MFPVPEVDRLYSLADSYSGCDGCCLVGHYHDCLACTRRLVVHYLGHVCHGPVCCLDSVSGLLLCCLDSSWLYRVTSRFKRLYQVYLL
jgi:hypothetical protein